jgi:histidine triad (HIT) family protein
MRHLKRFVKCYTCLMNEDCLFCSIANGDPEKLVWRNEEFAAFKDIHPKAPVHLLVVPKAHVLNLDHMDDAETAGRLLLAVREVAHQAGLKGGWRIQVNNGRPAGQVIDHLHFHVLGDPERTKLPE